MIEESTLTLESLLPLSGPERSRLEQCEQEIGRGIKTFFAVGAALSEIKDSRLYRCEFPNFESYCRERWDIGRAHAYRLIDSAGIIENLSPNGDEILPVNEAQARELLPYEPEAQKALWQIIVSTVPKGSKITAGHIRSVALAVSEIAVQRGMDDGSGITKPFAQLLDARITEETYERLQRQRTHIEDKVADSDEWLTADSPFLKAALRVLGGKIDLDPASCAEANKIIRAKKYYTKEESGLLHPWPGNVWLNGPFSFPAVQSFTGYATQQYDKGISKSIVCLTNNATGTSWCQSLLKRFLVCFPNGRVPFWRVGREGTGGTRDDQMFTYMGKNEARFIKEFSPLGTIVRAL
jgi:hypothetical protein